MKKDSNQNLKYISAYNPHAVLGKWTEVHVCRGCHSADLCHFLSLGLSPKPNGFLRYNDLKKPEPFYPLDVNFCPKCGMVQLRQIIEASEMFDHYVYASAASSPMVQHLKEMAHSTVKKIGLGEKNLVVDIGSNDGTLLSFFKNLGTKILGIDPAKNIAKEANKNGIRTYNAFFNANTAKKIKKLYGQADVITAANVIAHIPDWDSVFSGVNLLLKKNGTFIIEFPYLLDMLENMEFDTIYHEHLAMMAVSPLSIALERNGLRLVNIEHHSIHGGSLRVFIQKQQSARPKNIVNKYLLKEKAFGITKKKTYTQFAQKVYTFRENLITLINKLIKNNKKIIAYGASAKGNVILNFCNLHAGLIQNIVDSTSYKQGLYAPGTRIPVISETELGSLNADYALLTAWNFSDAILKKNASLRKKGLRFIIPIPKLTVL